MDIPEYIKKRNRRRSLSISDKLWEEIERSLKDTMSVSGFIKQAIVEKLEKDFDYKDYSEKMDYF